MGQGWKRRAGEGPLELPRSTSILQPHTDWQRCVSAAEYYCYMFLTNPSFVPTATLDDDAKDSPTLGDTLHLRVEATEDAAGR